MCQDAFGNPLPVEPGKVIEVPVWIRVKADWYERLLLGVIIIQLLVFGLFMVYGSAPARHTERVTEINRVMLCDMVNKTDPSLYRRYEGLRYCP